MRNTSWTYTGPGHSPPDRVLKKRAEEVHKTYSLFKLHLTRFAWGGPRVEGRARRMIIAWGNNVVRDCVADASSLGVEPERYFRNLVQQLPQWVVPVLISITINDKPTRDLLPGLNASTFVTSGDNSTQKLLFSLLKHENPPALPPDEIAIFVRLRDHALDRAWTRWLAAAGKSLDTRLLDFARAIQLFPKEGQSLRVKTILSNAGIPESKFSNLKPRDVAKIQHAPTNNLSSSNKNVVFSSVLPTVTQSGSNRSAAPRDSVPVPMRKIWPIVEHDITNGKLETEAIIEFVKLASKTPRLTAWVSGALVSAVSRLDRLPKTSVPQLLAELPRQLRSAGFLALRVAAAGQDNFLEQLLLLPKVEKGKAIGALHLSVRRQICTTLLALISSDWETVSSEKQAPVVELSAFASSTFSQLAPTLLPMLIARWRRLGTGSWRRTTIARLANLSADELLEFVRSAQSLDKYWSKLPIAAREALLESWIRNRQASPDLPKIAAEMCPSFVLDAVRWGDDPEALAELILGHASYRALSFLRRSGGRKDHRGWQLAIQRISRSGEIPIPLVKEARNNPDLLEDLVLEAMPAFRKTPLEGLDPAILFEPAMRWSWFAKRVDSAFSQDELRKALPKVRRRLATKPRVLAAAELAALIGMRHAMFLAYLSTRPFADRNNPGTRFDSLYRSWTLPKRSGGARLITSPVAPLKAIQRRLLDRLLQTAPCHRAATGFRRGLSIFDNARPHVGKRVVMNVDIAGFFPNTGFWLIRRAIDLAMPKWISEPARRLAADICTCSGVLPTGAPTSPAIANIVLLPADRAISTVATRNKLSYTRYADDITISGDSPTHILPFIRDVLQGLGYEIDSKKTNIFRRGRRQIVTGLVVNDKVSVPRSVRRRLRAAVHRAKIGNGSERLTWHKRSMSIQELQGRIAFTGVAHPEEAASLAKQIREMPPKP